MLDGADAVAEYRTQAIELAGDLLADIRGGYWPPEEARRAADRAVLFADPASFLARFFPADSAVIRERSATLASAVSLAVLRSSRGVSQAELARQALSPERLRLIEKHGLRAAWVHEAEAIVRALGGRSI